jgi:hypothetical protein
MKQAFSFVVLALMLSFLASCIIRSGPRHRHQSSRSSASCPPAHHWNGGACVHNGRARGHRK